MKTLISLITKRKFFFESCYSIDAIFAKKTVMTKRNGYDQSVIVTRWRTRLGGLEFLSNVTSLGKKALHRDFDEISEFSVF